MAARAFYRVVLGLKEVPVPASVAHLAAAWFERGEFRVHLGVDPNFHPAKKAHPAFLVAGLDQIVQRLERAGISIVQADVVPGYRRCHIFDPFGNRIELIEAIGKTSNPVPPSDGWSTRPFQIADEKAVVELWGRCGLIVPQNDPRKDIQRKLRVRPDLFRVGLLDATIVAVVMIGYDGHRGWINYLAVDPEHRRKGFGRRLMKEAEELLRAEGCAKINLQVRTSNQEVVAFYNAIGFQQDDVVSLGLRLEKDEPRT